MREIEEEEAAAAGDEGVGGYEPVVEGMDGANDSRGGGGIPDDGEVGET